MVAAHLAMIRSLTAQESLRRVTEIQLGMGLMKSPHREQIITAWRRDASMMFSQKRRITLEDLTAPGLPVVEVKRSA